MAQPWENDAVVGQAAPSAPPIRSGPVFVPAPGAARDEARKDTSEARQGEQLDISRAGEARSGREETRKSAGDLRGEFAGQDVVKAYQEALPAFTTMLDLATKPSKAGDFAIITQFNKVQDPGSIVSPGEREGAGDVDTLYQKFKTQLEGKFDPKTGFVSDDARRQFVGATLSIISERKRAYDAMRSRYSDLASSPEYGVDPNIVVGKHYGEEFFQPIEEKWAKIFPSGAGQGGDIGLEVSKGGGSVSDQAIANAQKLQEAWNNGASPDEVNALSQQLIGAPLAPDQLERLRQNVGKPVNFAPPNDQAGGAGGMGTGAAIGAGLLKGYTGNMAEEIVGQFDPVSAAKLQAAGDAASEASPLATFGGELVGGVLSPLNKIPGARAIENPLVREGVTGAIQGGVYGAGEAPLGADLSQRLTQGATGAVLGGGAGAVAGRLLGGRGAALADDAAPSMEMPGQPVPDVPPSVAPEAPPVVATQPVAPASPTSFVRTHQGIDYPVEIIERGVTDAEGNVWAKVKGETGEVGFVPDAEIRPKPAASPEPNVPTAPLTEAAPVNIPQEELSQIADLARKAVTPGLGSAAAKREIAKMAKTNQEAAAAAERLGIELPADILSDSAQLKALSGLSRAQIGSGAQAEWRNTVTQTVEKADAAMSELGATRDLAETSDGVFDRMNGAMESLERQAGTLRDEVDQAISATDRLEASSLQQSLAARIAELGGLKEAKQAMSSEERKLLAMLGEGETANMPTYGRLIDLKTQIGRAINKGDGPWADVSQAALKRYYGALADDQLAYIGKVGGEEMADKMRGSNTLFAKMYDARKDMQALFGAKLEGSLTPLLTRAIEQGSKGDAKALNALLARVPEDMRGQLLASGLLAKASGTGYQGGFNFANYAKYYRGLRQNGPVYAEFAKALGPKGEQVLSDLYAVSRRVAEGDANIPRTGASNQALLALNAERLLSGLFKSGVSRAASSGTGATAGAIVGGPAGAAVGAAVGDAVANRLSGGTAKSDKLHALLTSPQFKAMIANGGDTDINRLAGAKPFIEWSKGIIPDSFKDRQAWIRATINPVAANNSPEPPTIEVGAP